MDKFYFDYVYNFCKHMSNTYCSVVEKDQFSSVSVIAKYEEMLEIVKELICIGYGIRDIELESKECTGYKYEYICHIYRNEIIVEKFKRETGYYNEESEATFVVSNCNINVLKHIKSENVYEVELCEEDDDDSTVTCKYTTKLYRSNID